MTPSPRAGTRLSRLLVLALAFVVNACGDNDPAESPGPVDVTAPAAVTSLKARGVSGTSILLTWAAPGDDSSSGAASEYSVRLSTEAISDNAWDHLPSLVRDAAPKTAGASESLSTQGLDSLTTYYFAMKSADEAHNWSAISNLATATTLETSDTIPPSKVEDLRVDLTSLTTVWLSWTAVGDDGCQGTASRYEVRYATSPLTEGSWSAAIEVPDSRSPVPCGGRDSLTVVLPDGPTRFWFAMKTIDNGGNASPLSNVVEFDAAIALEDTRWGTEPVKIRQFEPNDGIVRRIVPFQGGLAVSGLFHTIDGIELNSVGFWNGIQWEPLGAPIVPWPPDDFGGLPKPSFSIELHGAQLIAGGAFWNFGPNDTYVSIGLLDRWDGSTWTGLWPLNGVFASVDRVFSDGSELYYTGRSHTPATLYLARHTDSGPEVVSTPNGEILAFATQDASFVVGGTFTTLDGLPFQHVALRSGDGWAALGDGLDGTVAALASNGERLLAGGRFGDVGGLGSALVAEWDGVQWSPLGDGLSSSPADKVNAIVFHGDDIIVAGSFPQVDDRGIRNIAQWDGTEWRRLGSGIHGSIEDLASAAGVVYAVGEFDTAGGKFSPRIASWR